MDFSAAPPLRGKWGWSYPKQIKATSYLANLAFFSGQILRANFVIESCSLRKIFHILCFSEGSTDCRWPEGLVPGGCGVSAASLILQSDCSYWQTCLFTTSGKGPKTLGMVNLGGSGTLEWRQLNLPSRVCFFLLDCLGCRPFPVFAAVRRKKKKYFKPVPTYWSPQSIHSKPGAWAGQMESSSHITHPGAAPGKQQLKATVLGGCLESMGKEWGGSQPNAWSQSFLSLHPAILYGVSVEGFWVIWINLALAIVVLDYGKDNSGEKVNLQ